MFIIYQCKNIRYKPRELRKILVSSDRSSQCNGLLSIYKISEDLGPLGTYTRLFYIYSRTRDRDRRCCELYILIVYYIHILILSRLYYGVERRARPWTELFGYVKPRRRTDDAFLFFFFLYDAIFFPVPCKRYILRIMDMKNL